MDVGAVVGVSFTAAALGVMHGIEPDHVAGISALTHEAGSAKLSAIVGACFGVGHVVLVGAWIAGVYVLLGTTSIPPAFEAIGLVVVGIVLAILGAVLGITGARKYLHKHNHVHSEAGNHTHYHLHVPAVLGRLPLFGADEHSHEHGVFEYLKVGVIGALFTLSPPLSMIAFLSVVLPSSTRGLLVPVVLVYGVAITTTMALIGSGVGAVFGFAKEKNEKVFAASQVCSALVISLFGGFILWQNLPQVL